MTDVETKSPQIPTSPTPTTSTTPTTHIPSTPTLPPTIPQTTPQTQPSTTDSNACVLASTLSATFIILCIIICGVLFYLYQRKQKKSAIPKSPEDGHPSTKKSGPKNQTLDYSRYQGSEQEESIPPLPIKPTPKNQKSDYHNNQGFQLEPGYNVPPTRQAPLPRKQGKKKEGLTVSPYHGTMVDQDDYSVPPSRTESFTEPPLPPNLAKKLKRQTEWESTRPESASSSNYLAMGDVRDANDELYQNINAAPDDIYINN